MAYIGVQPTVGNFQACDAITTSATTTFNLLVGGVAISPQSAQHCLVSLNGVLQAPISSYTISGSTIIFAAALTTDDSIDFITVLGDVLDLGVPSDDTVGAAQIKADLISGTTALTSAPAATDEFLISDAGVLKRIDASLVVGNTKQIVTTQTGAVATGTTVFPEDDTIPQNDEGDEYMTLAITPKSSTSRLLITAQVFGSVSSGTRWGIGLFKDSTANALSFATSFVKDATSMATCYIEHSVISGGTSEQTFKIRAGGLSSATFTFNGQSGNRKFGGVILSSIHITEIEV